MRDYEPHRNTCYMSESQSTEMTSSPHCCAAVLSRECSSHGQSLASCSCQISYTGRFATRARCVRERERDNSTCATSCVTASAPCNPLRPQLAQTAKKTPAEQRLTRTTTPREVHPTAWRKQKPWESRMVRGTVSGTCEKSTRHASSVRCVLGGRTDSMRVGTPFFPCLGSLVCCAWSAFLCCL